MLPLGITKISPKWLLQVSKKAEYRLNKIKHATNRPKMEKEVIYEEDRFI